MSATVATIHRAPSDAPRCPKCGGHVWDNRASKRNPKAPDFRCRDRSCDGVLWPGQHNAESVSVPTESSNARGKGSEERPGETRGPLAATVDRIVGDSLRLCYLDVTRFVLSNVRPLYEEAAVPCTDSTLAAITATLFIATCRGTGRGGTA
jgi:hypothetical protein